MLPGEFGHPLGLPGRAEGEPPLLSGLPGLAGVGNPEPLTAEVWAQERGRLRGLLERYEYGAMPPPPQSLQCGPARESTGAVEGLATVFEVEVRTVAPTASFHLMVIKPSAPLTKLKCFVGLNFGGNGSVLADASSPGLIAAAGAGPAAGPASAAGTAAWPLQECVRRGYALATVCYQDVVPDREDLAEPRLRAIRDEIWPSRQGARRQGGDTGCLAMWAWALSRAADVLSCDPAIDTARMAVFGHSRNGKAALLAGAYDERFALVISHQSGCGGAAPCRLPAELGRPGANGRPLAETVASITSEFPHWFCPDFQYFGDHVEQLPFDQHHLIALCAPRPVLLSNAEEDLWANPGGQFEMLEQAAPVYQLLSGETLGAPRLHKQAIPAPGTLLAGRLGYFLRRGGHSQTSADWEAWLSYADAWL